MNKLIRFKRLPHQKKLLTSKKPYVAMICGRGAGKTFSASLLAALRVLKGQRIIVFAQNYKALSENLMYEITKRLDEIVGHEFYKYNRGACKIEVPWSGGVIYGGTYENINSVRGFTQINILILDEGALSPPNILEVAGPCLRGLPEGQKPQIYFTSTPKGGSWLNLFILDKLAKEPDKIDFIQARTIDNSFISSTEYELMLSSFTNEAVIKQELGGELLNLEAENSILSGVDCKISEHPIAAMGDLYIGIDCAGYGKDKTVITYRIHDGYMQFSYDHLDGMEAKDKIKSMLKTHPGWNLKQINIDMAYGDSIYEALIIEYECVDLINFGAKPNDDQYLNQRAEMYFTLVDALRKGFPIGETVHKELQNTLFEWSSTGKLKLIAKEDIKAVLGHSPDNSDSLALTFANTIYNNIKIDRPVETTQIYLGSPED